MSSKKLARAYSGELNIDTTGLNGKKIGLLTLTVPCTFPGEQYLMAQARYHSVVIVLFQIFLTYYAIESSFAISGCILQLEKKTFLNFDLSPIMAYSLALQLFVLRIDTLFFKKPLVI